MKHKSFRIDFTESDSKVPAGTITVGKHGEVTFSRLIKKRVSPTSKAAIEEAALKFHKELYQILKGL